MIGEQIKLRMVDGGVIQSLGEVEVEITLGDQIFQHVATIADIESSAVIGYDFLKKHGSCLDFGCSTLLVNGVSLACVRLNQLTENLHITVGEPVTLAPYSETISTIDHPKKSHILPESILVKLLNHISLMDGLLVAKIVLDPKKNMMFHSA